MYYVLHSIGETCVDRFLTAATALSFNAVADEQERAGLLPPHRTRRISLTKTQLRTELGAELLSLCESVTADGKLTPEEAQALRQWLDDSAVAHLSSGGDGGLTCSSSCVGLWC